MKLRNSYIQVRRELDGELTFGGDQGFFKMETKDIDAEKKSQSGCGIVALADTFLYLSSWKKSFVGTWMESYVNHALTEVQYRAYYNQIYYMLGGVSLRNGASGLKLARGFNRLARQQHINLKGRWAFSGKKILSRIEQMLEKDIPVILCVPKMVGKKVKEHKLGFYQYSERELVQKTAISAHYVVVTGINMLSEMEQYGVNTSEKRTLLEISSWGKKYYIDWQEYKDFIDTHFLGTILGNILYIR